MKIAGKSFSGRLKLLPVFCAGLLAGIVIMNLGKSILLENTGLFDEDTLYHMKYMTVDGSALFSYVFRKRIMTVLILAMLATTYLGLAVCVGTAFWYGMSAGGYLTALALRYGLKGILLALAGVFPQYLLYVPA
ncbi:MAG: stage II sporulation protein M, partial [Acetatifactor sp.]|nr:stage II sporulation protein M [Acetatifactor sp.]